MYAFCNAILSIVVLAQAAKLKLKVVPVTVSIEEPERNTNREEKIRENPIVGNSLFYLMIVCICMVLALLLVNRSFFLTCTSSSIGSGRKAKSELHTV